MTNFGTTHDADSELLSAYIDNQLTPGERATLEARLEREPVLRQTLNELRFTVEALRELQLVRPPRSFALDPAMVQPRSFWQLPATWMRLGSALAALLLVITVTLDVGGRGAASTATQAPAMGQTTSGWASAAAPTAAAAAPMVERATEATSAPAAESLPAEKQPEASVAAAAATAAPAASGGTAAAPTTAAAMDSAMSAVEAPSAPAADTTANVPLAQSSGSSSPDTTNIEQYGDKQQEPQIVSSQPRSLLVLEIALGALALLLLAGSFWGARRKA